MANFVSYSDMNTLMTAIGQKFAALNGAYVVKGNSTFANLPASLTAGMTGYVYNVTDGFTTDSRFVEGAGKVYPADTNVVVVNLGDATTPNMKFDVIGSFVDVAGLEAAIQEVSDTIEATFDPDDAYSIGDYVIKDGVIYKFKAAHTSGDPWDATEVDEIGTVIDLIMATSGSADGRVDDVVADLAPAFSASTAYSAGDVVTYGDTVYQFTADHAAGAWTGSDATAVDLATLIAGVQSDVDDVDDRVDDVVSDLAPAFSTATAYAEGDVVTYQDGLYKFTAAHAAGAWSSSDTTAITVADLEPDSLTTAQITALEALLG